MLFVAAILAVAAIAPPETVRAALATAASALVEAMPFLLAGRLLSRAAGAHPTALAYLGCGCGAGPAARSLPAAAATWLVFGPGIACARLAAAMVVARLLRRDEGHACVIASDACGSVADAGENMGETHVRLEDRCFGSGVLADATAMLPSAVLAGIATQVLAAVDLSHANVAISLAAGAVLGFAAAPCALGGVALAGALHAHAPIAATAFLCVAGLFDARTLLHRAPAHHGNDCFAYLLTATALGLVALHGGAGLVNPAITVPLGACAIFLAALFVQHRRARCPSTRIAPALMLAGALVAAPPPIYRATETTLAGGFPGERVTFLGVLARDASHDALVRYAITCCRADAAPIALRLASPVPYPAGTWLRTDGTLVADGDSLVYEATHVERATPPLDPFVYR